MILSFNFVHFISSFVPFFSLFYHSHSISSTVIVGFIGIFFVIQYGIIYEVKKTDELNYVEIGKRMKNKRVELKLTQEKLSELIDVSPSYVSEIERGTSICSLSTITKIASVLALNLDYLVLGINLSNVDTTFGELLNSIPEEHRNLYLDLCENLANTFKK